MSSVVRPKGRLPARVYWTRRLLLLALVTVLVVVLARVAAGGQTPTAATQGHRSTVGKQVNQPRDPVVVPRHHRVRDRTADHSGRHGRLHGRHHGRHHRPSHDPHQAGHHGRNHGQRPAHQVLASAVTPQLSKPVGPCRLDQVMVEPDVATDEVAGRPVVLRLGLRTTGPQPCTVTIGPDRLALKITTDSDSFWTSDQCPSAIPDQTVVVRPDWVTLVPVQWSGHRSGRRCAPTTVAARPGDYTLDAAIIGGEPARTTFRLVAPPTPAPTDGPSPTEGPSPSGSPSPSGTASPSSTPSPSSTASPTSSPSG